MHDNLIIMHLIDAIFLLHPMLCLVVDTYSCNENDLQRRFLWYILYYFIPTAVKHYDHKKKVFYL